MPIPPMICPEKTVRKTKLNESPSKAKILNNEARLNQLKSLEDQEPLKKNRGRPKKKREELEEDHIDQYSEIIEVNYAMNL